MQSKENSLPLLVIAKAQAKSKIYVQIIAGKALHIRPMNHKQGLENAENKYSKWSDYNIELLNRIFSNNSYATEYENNIDSGWGAPVVPSFEHMVKDLYRRIQKEITTLESIRDRIDLMEEPISIKTESAPISNAVGSDIFVVHGHDEAAKLMVARFLEKIQLNPIILHEQPNEGRTIIKKFEDYSNVGFAVIIMTPDDIGKSKEESDFKPRARQNVILELGFFLGKLGRKRVCVLYKEGVEMPTDYSGVLYVSIDSEGAWKLKLAREIKVAGLQFDFNKVVE